MDLIKQIARESKLPEKYLTAALQLLDEGNTVPFISRYRKEVTGEMDENQLRFLEERMAYLRNLEKRKQDVIASIEEQGKLTSELSEKISKATILQEVEDLYLPYRPKRRTRASIAKEKGLEPLAILLLQQIFTKESLQKAAEEFITEDGSVEDAAAALAGAQDILAEKVAEDAELRTWVRNYSFNQAILKSQAVDAEKVSDFTGYYDYEEPVLRLPPHRVLALNRGETEGFLKLKLVTPREFILNRLQLAYQAPNSSAAAELVAAAAADGYDRLMTPSIERDIRTALTEKAEIHAIESFAENMRNLLLQPTVRNRVVMGVDPAFRTGCKLAVVDDTGKLLDLAVIYPTPPHRETEQSAAKITEMIEKHQVDCLAIGNGTASRETEFFVAETLKKIPRPVFYTIVNEAGASVYSASKLAGEEFPALDVSERSAISIARRLQDPLAELVKIDPKSIGVGLYQHDVNQKQLGKKLDAVVESVVNHVGVDLNTASPSLLQYVSGLKANVAKNIVSYREQNQRFKKRSELKKVAGLGAQSFIQAAGFLRIVDGDEPFDNTPIHPESYPAAKDLLAMLKIRWDKAGIAEFTAVQKSLTDHDVEHLAEAIQIGVPTLRDILEALARPGRDPRDDLPPVVFSRDVLNIEDVKVGMILQGIVRNVIDFGCFVDIGVHQDGLVHVSEISHSRISHPSNAVKVGDHVQVMVISLDKQRNRIGLSMKQAK